jgi:cell division protein FtsB
MANRIKKRRKKKYGMQIFKDTRMILVFIVILISLFLRMFIPVFSRKHKLQERRDALEVEINNLQEKSVELKKEVNLLQDDNVYIEKIARQELGLAREGEIVYNFVVSENLEKKTK